MGRTVFVTGATGFIGRNLLPKLFAEENWAIRVLVRDCLKANGIPEGADIVVGDLLEIDSYSDALSGVDTVLHLGALTGKASKSEHDRINREATAALISASRSAGVERFLFVSTIAAGYPDKAFYPYAKAKALAERELVGSGLEFCTLRPTVILGNGSAIWDSLNIFVVLPIVPIPVRAKPTLVQPIHVDDVSRGIVELIRQGRFNNEVLDLGGADTLPMRDFLEKIAIARFGHPKPVIQLPLRLVQWPLAAIEPIAQSILPATAGQFAIFGNHSTARRNWLMDYLSAEMTPLSTMIDSHVKQNDLDSKDNNEGPSDQATSESDATREARVLGCHMSGTDPSEAAVQHYVQALSKLDLMNEGTAFDRLTLSMARQGGPALWLVDAFAGLIYRRGTLRRRQVLLAAILEADEQTHSQFDLAIATGPIRALLGLLATGAISGVVTILSLLILLPVRLWFWLKTNPRSGGRN